MTNSITTIEISDEIEAENKCDYMKLPVDADGLAIHIGDEMFGDCPSGKHVSGRVIFVGENRFLLENVQFSLRGDYMHHVKPDPLVELLEDFAKDYLAFYYDNYMNYDGTDTHVIKKHVDRIRKMFDGDAERASAEMER